MVRRSMGGLGLALLMLWMLMSPGSAQALDPVARTHALSLYAVYQQANLTGNWQPFYDACGQDPLMTRKAFISTLLFAAEMYQSKPADAQSALMFANALATLIKQNFGDPTPAAIIEGMVAGLSQDELMKMTTIYALQLYPELATGQTIDPATGELQPAKVFDPATQKYGDGKERVSQLPAWAWAMLKPIYKKVARVDMAISFSNPELSIQELDTFKPVAVAAHDEVTRLGIPQGANDQQMFTDLLNVVEAPKLVILAELGLSNEFDARLEGVLALEKDTNAKAGLLLSGVYQALERGDHARARSLLARIRPILQGAYVRPALEYGVRTAEFRVRHLGQPRPSQAQLSKEFQQAWNAVADFRPFVLIAADQYWYFARQSTRFWLREFSVVPGGEAEAIKIMAPTMAAWTEKGNFDIHQQGWTPDDMILHNTEITSGIGVTLGIMDQTLAVLEALPEPPPAMLGVVEEAVIELAALPRTLGWDTVEPGFPAYDLTKGGLYSEILARTKYLRAKDPKITPDKALALLAESLTLVEQAGFPDTELDLKLRSGLLYQKLGRPDLAIAVWKEALARANSLEYVERSTEVSALLAQEFGRQKNWEQAGLYADQTALRLEESVALVSADPEAARKLSVTSQLNTEVSVKAALQANDPQKALAALVKGKEAQTAVSQMRGQQAAQGEVMVVQQYKQEVAALTQQVVRLEAMPASQTRDALLAQTEKLLAGTKTEFLSESRKLRQKYPDLYSRVLKFDPLDLPDVQKTLPADAAVIQYFPTDDGLYVFVVTRDIFRLRLVPISEKALDEAVTSYVRGVRRNAKEDSKLESESKALYASLIQPCAEDIEGKSILVLIPSGRLNILPFACLTTADGSPLIEKKLVLELAKPTDFMRIAQNTPKKIQTVVAFANATGDLPAATREGKEIAAMFPGSKLFDGKTATKKNFFDFGSGAEVLHLATHGESNSENALTNYLAMTGDEQVAQEEIFALGLENTSIVTLSACNTAVGDRLDSKFVASLAEAFWLGGSQSVVASLWSVNDASTSLLMTEFYKGLKAGKGRALALKDAQLTVRSTPGFEHPFHWAGFLLFGDWR